MYGSRMLVLSTILVILFLTPWKMLAGNGKNKLFDFPILQQVTYIINDKGITKANEETSALAIFCQSILFTHGDCGLFRLPLPICLIPKERYFWIQKIQLKSLKKVINDKKVDFWIESLAFQLSWKKH